MKIIGKLLYGILVVLLTCATCFAMLIGCAVIFAFLFVLIALAFNSPQLEMTMLAAFLAFIATIIIFFLFLNQEPRRKYWYEVAPSSQLRRTALSSNRRAIRNRRM